jgi:hypothetical protein
MVISFYLNCHKLKFNFRSLANKTQCDVFCAIDWCPSIHGFRIQVQSTLTHLRTQLRHNLRPHRFQVLPTFTFRFQVLPTFTFTNRIQVLPMFTLTNRIQVLPLFTLTNRIQVLPTFTLADRIQVQSTLTHLPTQLRHNLRPHRFQVLPTFTLTNRIQVLPMFTLTNRTQVLPMFTLTNRTQVLPTFTFADRIHIQPTSTQTDFSRYFVVRAHFRQLSSLLQWFSPPSVFSSFNMQFFFLEALFLQSNV